MKNLFLHGDQGMFFISGIKAAAMQASAQSRFISRSKISRCLQVKV
jgi:hypothetical protein